MGAVLDRPVRVVTRLTRGEIYFLLLATLGTWVGSEFGEGGEPSLWFSPTPIGIPLHYVLFGFLLLVVSPYVIQQPTFSLSNRLRQIGLLNPLLAAAAILGLSLAVAIVRGVPELFADWRNLIVTSLTAIFSAKWLNAQSWKRFAITDLATLYGLLSVPHLVSYALGGGFVLLGVRTPIFEGTALYLAAFSAIVAAWNIFHHNLEIGTYRTILLRLAGLSGSILVLLAFRRSFWLVWAVGLIAVFLLYLRSQHVRASRVAATAIVGGILLIVPIAVLGSSTVVSRVGSFLPTDNSTFSATNEDHLNDLVDAWTIITDHPILGFGIGKHYETNLIADWKAESFEVHNAILHVWLKFGIAGALTYVWFHFALVRASFRWSVAAPIGAFIIGQFAGTIFGTWPYGRFQMAIFLGLAIALVAIASDLPIEAGEEASAQRLPISDL